VHQALVSPPPVQQDRLLVRVSGRREFGGHASSVRQGGKGGGLMVPAAAVAAASGWVGLLGLHRSRRDRAIRFVGRGIARCFPPSLRAEWST
jgi:hypothetical protein